MIYKIKMIMEGSFPSGRDVTEYQVCEAVYDAAMDLVAPQTLMKQPNNIQPAPCHPEPFAPCHSERSEESRGGGAEI